MLSVGTLPGGGRVFAPRLDGASNVLNSSNSRTGLHTQLEDALLLCHENQSQPHCCVNSSNHRALIAANCINFLEFGFSAQSSLKATTLGPAFFTLLPPPMWTQDITRAIGPSEVSPELLQPLVTVVATLGKLGAIPGDISLGGNMGSLRARLLTFSSGVRRAMVHPDGDATLLRCALGASKEQPGAPTAITDSWQKAVTTVKDIWAELEEDAACLRDACGNVAAAKAATEATKGHLVEAVTQEDKAHKGLIAATRVVPLSSEVAQVTEVVAAHDMRVAEAREGLQAATKATEEVAVAVVASVAAKERGQHAAVAHGFLVQLVAACMGAYNYYSHVEHCLKDIKAMVGVTTGYAGPDVPKATQGDMGIPKELAEIVVVAEALWDASARLTQEHLLGTLRGIRSLLATSSVTEATKVTQRCQEATDALPGLLPPGLC